MECSLKNSIKGSGGIRLFRRFFIPLLTKNYTFSIKMPTRIKRLSTEICYDDMDSLLDEHRKDCSRDLMMEVGRNANLSIL
jgi:hypothetical protein